jgi:predicted RNase H-like HicB family nuclease
LTFFAPCVILLFRRFKIMLKHKVTVVIEKDEDGILTASAPSIKGCHTQAKDLPTLLSRIKEAIELCLESEKGEIFIPEFIGLQEIEVSV